MVFTSSTAIQYTKSKESNTVVIGDQNIGTFQIITQTKEEFDEIFLKLRKLGFVYATERLKTIEGINDLYAYYPIILIGDDRKCRMVLHGRSYVREDCLTVSFDEFVTKHFQAYYAA